MSMAVVKTFAGQGVWAPEVAVEVHLANGLPAFQLVGMAETSVKEARERVRSALINSGFEFPAKRITVNLAPADIPKHGGRFDLPIAVGILVASGYLPDTCLYDIAFVGELGLNGEIKSVGGLIPILMASAKEGLPLIFPGVNDLDAAIVSGAIRYPAFDLLSVYEHLAATKPLKKGVPFTLPDLPDHVLGWDDIIGQAQAKRALTIAAAGAHNLLMVGPQGTGKSLLASRLLSLLPPMSEEEALEVAAIVSVKGDAIVASQFTTRPMRTPHHTCSAVALTGGGSQIVPGEVSLAHHGVLFLDELPEFGRKALEVLREPLETGDVHISRASGSATYPANFQLIAAMNPSPTGDIDDNRLTPQQQLNYLNRLSGPLLDRIDIQVEVPRLENYDLTPPINNSDDSIHHAIEQVLVARAIQLERQGKPNAHVNGGELAALCQLSQQDLAFLQAAAKQLNLSMRVFHRTLKVARTLADLDAETKVNRQHLSEALGYRALDTLIKQLSTH
ncbi:YifB family Mg chelatase-like AAA ATPase [Alteromonas sp. 345S023]|uniref:YifB family Mg chelatase-like AAA ATPase n=1 Tax=Alteromonas profundi TaxID=2696062 RepID=A0A7X5LKS8_9ALTE|nr:YifB family Mg chelatase-like AAA ATPase [Alteromonas profundi]NDV90814.1 YifB family Mg chelatase-like AAA ATPase [Alteromonas profundi]